MKLIAGGLNGRYLLEVHENAVRRKTEHVRAAVAYASGDPRLIRDCFQGGIRLSFWCRYDETVPVSTNILKRFLDRKSPNFTCRLIPDIFHAKVIWWVDVGVYIGSANLREKAWASNIEAGVYLEEDELDEAGIREELEDFFRRLDEESHPLTGEIYKELCDLEKTNRGLDRDVQRGRAPFNRSRLLPEHKGLAMIVPKKGSEKARNTFLKEWNETLETLRQIAERVSADRYRPRWVGAEVPKGAQADQFLHAHYYANVRKGNIRSLHMEHFEENRADPEAALVQAMEWWAALEAAPHHEDRMLNNHAVLLRERLQPSTIRSMTEEEFIEVCGHVHALKSHANRVRNSTYGDEAPTETVSEEERVRLFGRYLMRSRSDGGKGVLELLEHLLYGGGKRDLPERLWTVHRDRAWRIPRLGVNSLGEIVGWAMPDDFPPRNGRTSKSLKSLGFDVWCDE